MRENRTSGFCEGYAQQRAYLLEPRATLLTGGVIIGIFGFVFTPYMLQVMHTPESVMNDATVYMRIFFCGTIASLFYNMCAAILRAVGDSKGPVIIGLIGSTINVGLNLLFVVVFRQGVAAVAVATILSQCGCAIIGVYVLIREDKRYRLLWRKIRLHKDILGQMLKLGLPLGLQTVMYGLANGVVQTNINIFGTDTMAAWTAYSKIAGFYWTVLAAMGITVATFVSQNHGAGSLDRVKQSVRQSMALSVGITIVMSFIFYKGSEVLIGFFTKDAEVLSIGVTQLKFLSPLLILYIESEIMSGALRGMGYSFGPTVISLVFGCGLSVVWVEIAMKVSASMISVLASFPATWFASSAALVLYWIHKIKQERDERSCQR